MSLLILFSLIGCALGTYYAHMLNICVKKNWTFFFALAFTGGAPSAACSRTSPDWLKGTAMCVVPPSSSKYSLEVPSGYAAGQSYDITVKPNDGQTKFMGLLVIIFIFIIVIVIYVQVIYC
jgi:hypothetical protein